MKTINRILAIVSLFLAVACGGGKQAPGPALAG